MTNYEELQKLATTAARRVAYQWPEHVTVEDLAQDICIRLLETQGSLDRLFDEPDLQTRQAFLIKVAHQLASAQQTEYERFTGNYIYDTAEVRGLLERQVWLHDPDRFRPEIADLTEGMARLAKVKSNHYAELINRFQHEIMPDRTSSSAHSRISRAVESLTMEMNILGSNRRKDFIEGPGTRKAMSNHAAATTTKAQNDAA